MGERPQISPEWLKIFRILQVCKQRIGSLLLDLLGSIFQEKAKSITLQNLPGQFIPSLGFYIPEPDFRNPYQKH